MSSPQFTVLVANRGAIACRIFRTLKKLGYGSVAVYSEADAHARHVREADVAVLIGPPPARESYLQTDKIIEAARQTGAHAIHPGYGFLSENANFAAECEKAGILFLGPTPDQIHAFGLKHTARELAVQNNLPLLPGTGLIQSIDEAVIAAQRLEYPVILKSTAGGGGIGMQVCQTEADLRRAFESVQRMGQANFGNSDVFLERYVSHARHIEVQIFGDGQGHVLAIGERDCSLQRRNQKVVEETPAPRLPEKLRAELLTAARKLGESVNYRSAGTVEFLYDARREEFYFLEVNSRLQVEHGVTEEVTGIDLVEWMVRLGEGTLPPLPSTPPVARGHSIQARVYAENPIKNFQPSSGLLTEAVFPHDLARCDTWVETGTEVSGFYDPLLAKIIVHAPTREEALAKMSRALAATSIAGIATNLEYLAAIFKSPVFARGEMFTRYLQEFTYTAHAIEVIAPGTLATVQDYPGRLGYWDVGVPPSGPMDDLSFRLGNRLLDNPPDAAGLEFTVSGATLKFHVATRFCLTGATMEGALDGTPISLWKTYSAPANSTLRLGKITGAGQRSYLLVAGGIQVPKYLGSRATFTLGRFGGHGGRALRSGDILPLDPAADSAGPERALAPALQPVHASHWEIRVLDGPHGAPDFFTPSDIETFFATDWKVHYNSSPTGIRLIGPKPVWARQDGGEAGLHPSNIHDNAYAIGAVDFTGDMPVILGPDGPSLGGFVCPVTIIKAELWKMGQLRPGDTIRFQRVSIEEATTREASLDEMLASLDTPAPLVFTPKKKPGPDNCVIHTLPDHTPAVVYRQSGDDNLLIEYGPPVLDLKLRFRVHALWMWLREQRLPGIIDLTPGVRSLQIHFDTRRLQRDRLLEILVEAEKELDHAKTRVPSRIVHLPLSWDDEAVQLAIRKYMQSVRADAPWCPSNIEFIRRINGLDSIEEVQRIVYEASYLVMGLGDVYLGAPVATPLDPRHRLVTTKYNPARTWTPENAVGIGGAYMCVYGMEGPGGYQFVGRTIQMWNRFRTTEYFEPGKPWLLRFFDQIRFYPVSAAELLQLREDFPMGKASLKIEESEFDLAEYDRFLASNHESISAFKTQQREAFQAERRRWEEAGQLVIGTVPEGEEPPAAEETLPEGCHAMASPLTGNLWKISVEEGARVEADQPLFIVESMKMENFVYAPFAGTVEKIVVKEGRQITQGQTVLVLKLF